MKTKKGNKSKPSRKQGLKDLPTKKTSAVKGGSKAHEMKKSLIGNFPR